MAGAFVACDGAEGFLPDSEGGAGATEGAVLAVRVTRAAQGGKGPRLTARLATRTDARRRAGRLALLRRGPGAVERSPPRYPEASWSRRCPALAAAAAGAGRPRAGRDARRFDDGARRADRGAGATGGRAPGGGAGCTSTRRRRWSRSTSTPAARRPRRQGKAAAQLAVNRAAMPEVARQIRLRNLSGAILVDLAGLSPRRRAALAPALARALARRSAAAALAGLHRARAWPRSCGRASIRRCTKCWPARTPPGWRRCAGSRAEAGARPASAPALRAAPAVVAALQADAEALPDLARRTGRPLICAPIPRCPRRRGRWRRTMTERRATEPTCPICGKPARDRAAPVLQPPLRGRRSRPLADRAIPHPRRRRRGRDEDARTERA